MTKVRVRPTQRCEVGHILYRHPLICAEAVASVAANLPALAYHLSVTWKVLGVEFGSEDEQIERHLGILNFHAVFCEALDWTSPESHVRLADRWVKVIR